MLSQLFLGLSLVGAEWVLYILLLLSILSVALMFDRGLFYRASAKGIQEFREKIRLLGAAGKWGEALNLVESRKKDHSLGKGCSNDLETEMASALLNFTQGKNGNHSCEVLDEVAYDALIRSRVSWEKNLVVLATIGNNAPFIGLFGTVLGIIRAFHDLSQQVGTGVQTVTSGIAEALIATAIGILVAIPAVVAFNFFQRKVKSAVAEAESLKSFLIGRLAH